MKKPVTLFLLALVSTGLIFISPASATKPVKNIILFISDGCGYNHITVTDYYLNGRQGTQVYEKFSRGNTSVSVFRYTISAAPLSKPSLKICTDPADTPRCGTERTMREEGFRAAGVFQAGQNYDRDFVNNQRTDRNVRSTNDSLLLR